MDDKHILTQLVITEALQLELDGGISRLREALGASAALLIERSGLLLSSSGDGMVNDLTISSLIAGIFKSISALTSLLNEPEVTTLQHRGNRNILILVLLESKDMLALLVPLEMEPDAIRGPVEAAVNYLTPLLIAARESTRQNPFSFSKETISVFLGRL